MFKILFAVSLICILLSCGILKEKESIIEYVSEIPNGLDPANNTDLFDTKIYANIYESLVNLDEDGFSIRPGLATHWHIDSNLTEYSFVLESEKKFHDGSPVNANAIVTSFRRQIVKNRSSPLFNMIERVESSDSLTIIIHLKYPYTQFLYTLTSPLGLKAISRKALDKHGDDIRTNPVGSGPFRIKRWDKKEKITLTRFHDFGNIDGNIEEITFERTKEYSKLEFDFTNEKVDIMYLIPGYYIDRLKWQGMIEYKITKPLSIIFLGFNTTSIYLKRLDIRQAILESIDLPKLVSYILRGNSIAAKGPLPPIFSPLPDQTQADYNLQHAKELMKNLNLKKDLNLKFFYVSQYMSRRTILEALENELRKINITLKMVQFDSYNELNKACKRDSAQIFLSSWQADVLGDPENFLYSLFYSTSDYNFFHYNNQQVDSWLDTARIEPDWKKRQKLYQKIVGQILEDVPAVFLYHVIPVYAYNRHKIKSLSVSPYGIINYHKVVLYE